MLSVHRLINRRTSGSLFRGPATVLLLAENREYAAASRQREFEMKHIREVFYCLCVSLVAACGGGGGSSAPPATVVVTPPMASVMVGQQIQLAATTNTTGPVTWSSGNV